MATFKELMQLAEITKNDKTSGHRLHEIEKILHKYHAFTDLTPEKATKILEELGPTFVKIGQLASDRSDMIPQDYANAFKQLRAHVEPEPFSEIIATIEDSLGHPWQETFVSIDEKPLGAASIAQVHKAVLRQEGNPVVALKVRRAQAAEQVAEDFMLIHHILAIADVTMHRQKMLLSITDFVNELEKTSEQEVDFTIECNNLVKFEKLLADVPGISSPHPYPEYSSDELLVMEYVEGVSVGNVEALKAQGDDPDKLGRRLAENFITQVLDWGFFHADPHAGNIIIRGHEIVWIDLGMMGELSYGDRMVIGDICLDIAKNDAFDLKDSLVTIAKPQGPVDQGQLLRELTSLVHKYGSVDLNNLDMGTCFYDIIELLRKNNLSLPSTMTMLARGCVALEGVLTEISPDVSVIMLLSDNMQKKTMSKEALQTRMRQLASEAAGSAEAGVRLPTQLSHILEIVERGELQGHMDMKFPTGFMDIFRSVVSILSLSLIATGLFVGSSLITLTNMEPRILEIPIFGFLGFLAGVMLSIYVVWRCMEGRKKEKKHEQD